jgi:hypothetical protein
MFAEYFNAAEKHLKSIGITPDIQMGQPVSEQHLDAVEHLIGQPIPAELRAYLREMGDGYCFSPGNEQEGFMIGWLGDYRYKVAGFVHALREEAIPERRGQNPPELVERELARRERWFPFYNFGGGGYMFCLDLNESPSPVRYYERIYWLGDPTEQWEFCLASSFLDMVRQWSRFCFAEVGGHTLISMASGASGQFDWDPSRFDSMYDRGTIDA